MAMWICKDKISISDSCQEHNDEERGIQMKKIVSLLIVLLLLMMPILTSASGYIYDTSSQNYSGSCSSYQRTGTYNANNGYAWISVTSENTYSRAGSVSGSAKNYKIWATSATGVQISDPSPYAASGGTATATVIQNYTTPKIYMTVYNYLGGSTLYFAGSWYATYGLISK